MMESVMISWSTERALLESVSSITRPASPSLALHAPPQTPSPSPLPLSFSLAHISADVINQLESKLLEAEEKLGEAEVFAKDISLEVRTSELLDFMLLVLIEICTCLI
jgi:hypothetical protein